MNPLDQFSGITHDVLHDVQEAAEGVTYGETIDLEDADGQVNLHVVIKPSNGTPTVATKFQTWDEGEEAEDAEEAEFDNVTGSDQVTQNVRLATRMAKRYGYTVTTITGSGTPKALIYGVASYVKKVI